MVDDPKSVVLLIKNVCNFKLLFFYLKKLGFEPGDFIFQLFHLLISMNGT